MDGLGREQRGGGIEVLGLIQSSLVDCGESNSASWCVWHHKVCNAFFTFKRDTINRQTCTNYSTMGVHDSQFSPRLKYGHILSICQKLTTAASCCSQLEFSSIFFFRFDEVPEIQSAS